MAEQADAPAGPVVVRRYSYRATAPGVVQARLARVFGGCRFVYNSYIALARAAYEAGERHPSAVTGAKVIVTAGRAAPETAWMRELPSHALTQSVRAAARAYENFFASAIGRRKGPRVGRPRFKKRSHRQSAFFDRHEFSINGGWRNTAAGGGRVWIAKVGHLHVNWHRPLPAAPSSMTVIHEADGSYRVTFVVDVPVPAPTRRPRAAGIDLGLTDFAAIVYSDGAREKIPNPRYLRQAQRKVRRLSKNLARKQRGSRNREHARRDLARAHARVREQRSTHARQLAARLTRENQAVAVETLNIRGMGRGRLARSIHDAGWGQFLMYLEEAAARRGRASTRVPAGFASSRICAPCGANTGAKPLHVREWTCPDCGAHLDRDYNAAVNILVAAGSAETRNACGRSIRLRLAGAATDEAGTHRNDRAHPGPASRKPQPRPVAAGGDSSRTHHTVHVKGGTPATPRRHHPTTAAHQPQKHAQR